MLLPRGNCSFYQMDITLTFSVKWAFFYNFENASYYYPSRVIVDAGVQADNIAVISYEDGMWLVSQHENGFDITYDFTEESRPVEVTRDGYGVLERAGRRVGGATIDFSTFRRRSKWTWSLEYLLCLGVGPSEDESGQEPQRRSPSRHAKANCQGPSTSFLVRPRQCRRHYGPKLRIVRKVQHALEFGNVAMAKIQRRPDGGRSELPVNV